MALVIFEDGPLTGQEKDVVDTNMLASEYPGYSATEQVMDPQRGQVVKTQWNGDQAAEAYYADSDQEVERMGNETGIRDRETQREMKTRQERRTAEQEQADQQNRESRSRTAGSRETESKKK